MIDVYGREYCKYCRMSKKILQEKNITYIYHDLDEIDVDESLITTLKQKYNMTTIPIILSENVLVGGYSELQDFIISYLEAPLGI